MSRQLRRHSPDEQQTQLYDKVTKLQTVIIESLSKLKKEKKHHQCKHYMEMSSQCQQYEPSVNYYDKFWKMYLMNEVCIARIEEMKKSVVSQGDQLVKIQGLFQKHQGLVAQKSRKKTRRTAQEIQRRFTCPYHKCFKVYGSDVSLNLHIKLKHNGGSKTDREKAAECIIEAAQKGQPIPRFRINLPPGFFEDCMKSLGQPGQRDQEDRGSELFEQANPNSNSMNIGRRLNVDHGDHIQIGNQPLPNETYSMGRIVGNENHESQILDDSDN